MRKVNEITYSLVRVSFFMDIGCIALCMWFKIPLIDKHKIIYSRIKRLSKYLNERNKGKGIFASIYAQTTH